MSNTRGILYPALQKFYSALSSLEKFEKGTNFFDNISYLDNFFSEYRNITFVLQKSLANAHFLSIYEKLRNQYLVNDVGRWFIEKRNEVQKQQPFNLEKRIEITIYSGRNTLTLPILVYNIENDVDISSIVKSLQSTFSKLGQLEIMFSAEFSFYEFGYSEDLYDNLITGIGQMKLFLAEIKNEINENCKICNELERKLDMMNFYRVPKDMLFIDDYIYYCKKKYFEKASRVALLPDPGQSRVPVEYLNKMYPDGDLFSKFELMHLLIFQKQKSLLPTCMILYSDDTFEFVTFGFSLKTTVYRKFNEIASRIESDKIIKILFVTEMYIYNKLDINNLDSRERVKYAKIEILAFYMVDNQLNTNYRKYDTLQVDDFKYITSIMFSKPHEHDLPNFLIPVMQEFTRLK